MNDNLEYGLVLAGGGTKGAYQVGVWKALKELNINITAIVGASIGSLNGALILQENFETMEKLYENIEINDIMKVNKELDTNKNIFAFSNLIKIASEYIENNGLENDALKNTIEKYIDIDKIYDSNINFGLVTYSLKNKLPMQLFKDEIKKEEMVDYLLASSCFPIFKAQKIGDIEFVDGGLYDNTPINMLIKKGYKNIIIADVSGLGFNKKLIDKNIYLKIISPNESLGGTFEFNHEKIKSNIRLGYLDTKKSFNKLQGHIYYFKDFNKLLEDFNLQTIYGLEYAATIYEIDKYKEYDSNEFLELLNKKHKEAELKYQEIKHIIHKKKVVELGKQINNIFDKGLGLCFITDVYLNRPMSKKFAHFKNLFEGYVESVDALLELNNYYKN